MNIIISNSDKRPIYEQIRSQIKDYILNGTLDEGERLPSIRVLAKELRISVITTKRAYDELESEGFIETVQGKGTFVARKNIDFLKEEQLRKIEKLLLEAVELSKVSDFTLEELIDILKVLYEEV